MTGAALRHGSRERSRYASPPCGLRSSRDLRRQRINDAIACVSPGDFIARMLLDLELEQLERDA